jgi:hypothetical protein
MHKRRRSLQEGAPHVLQPIVQPVWTVLERKRIIKFEGFLTVCMPCAMAMNYLDLEALARPAPSKEDLRPAPVSSQTPSAVSDQTSMAHPDEGSRAAPWDLPTASASCDQTSVTAPDEGGRAATRDSSQETGSSDVPSARASGGGSRRGRYGELLSTLEQVYGPEVYLKVARAAGQDAFTYVNARYGSYNNVPSLIHSWTAQHIHNYICLTWCVAARSHDPHLHSTQPGRSNS